MFVAGFNNFKGSFNIYSSITISWECTIIDEQEDHIPQTCKSQTHRDIYCCNKTSEICENKNWCSRENNNTKSAHFCNDDQMTKLESKLDNALRSYFIDKIYFGKIGSTRMREMLLLSSSSLYSSPSFCRSVLIGGIQIVPGCLQFRCSAP
jgi:hypothetical protein